MEGGVKMVVMMGASHAPVASQPQIAAARQPAITPALVLEGNPGGGGAKRQNRKISCFALLLVYSLTTYVNAQTNLLNQVARHCRHTPSR
jgi:hypothetical protein